MSEFGNIYEVTVYFNLKQFLNYEPTFIKTKINNNSKLFFSIEKNKYPVVYKINKVFVTKSLDRKDVEIFREYGIFNKNIFSLTEFESDLENFVLDLMGFFIGIHNNFNNKDIFSKTVYLTKEQIKQYKNNNIDFVKFTIEHAFKMLPQDFLSKIESNKKNKLRDYVRIKRDVLEVKNNKLVKDLNRSLKIYEDGALNTKNKIDSIKIEYDKNLEELRKLLEEIEKIKI